jgi:AraC family transcriptional regulator
VRALVYIQENLDDDLKQPGEPVTQIALDAGFAAHESFTRAFGNMFGTSPSNYRAGNQPPVYEELTGVEVRDLAPMRVVFFCGTWGRMER